MLTQSILHGLPEKRHQIVVMTGRSLLTLHLDRAAKRPAANKTHLRHPEEEKKKTSNLRYHS